MAEALKILGQLAPGDTNLADLYTVPALTQATISSITVCNRSTSATTFRLSVAVAGELDATKQYIFYDQELDANSTFTITIGITLSAADKIRVRAGTASVLTFNVFGIEVN
ncbi:hypothetical protein EBU71_12080 [bacterium]|nr:hypothetical protein [Candidatus Elulimicrobium humile]